MSRPTTRRMPRLETLETRQLLSADVTGEQQLVLELINEARIDPNSAAERVEESLTRAAVEAIANDGDTVPKVIAEIADAEPRPPVAWDAALASAAEGHTEYLIDLGYQTHSGPSGLKTPTDRADASGYKAPAAVVENVIYGVDSPEHAMRAFLADYGRGNSHDPHRENIQQTDASKVSHQDVGVAIVPVEVPVQVSTPFGTPSASTQTKLVVTQVFGRNEVTAPKLLGVVYDDADSDRFYDPEEGVSGATITITDKATGAATDVKTWSSGGYQAEVSPGDYQIEVRLGDRLIGRRDAVVDDENRKVDFRVDEAPKSSAQVATPAQPSSSIRPVSPQAPRTHAPAPTRPTTPVAPSSITPAPTARPVSTTTPTATSTTPRPKPAEGSTAAPPTRSTSSIDPMSLPSSTSPTSSNPDPNDRSEPGIPKPVAAENLKALERLRTLSGRAGASESTGGGSTITLLRSSLSGNVRSWKLAD